MVVIYYHSVGSWKYFDNDILILSEETTQNVDYELKNPIPTIKYGKDWTTDQIPQQLGFQTVIKSDDVPYVPIYILPINYYLL